jgi:hypothetical protein
MKTEVGVKVGIGKTVDHSHLRDTKGEVIGNVMVLIIGDDDISNALRRDFAYVT